MRVSRDTCCLAGGLDFFYLFVCRKKREEDEDEEDEINYSAAAEAADANWCLKVVKDGDDGDDDR